MSAAKEITRKNPRSRGYKQRLIDDLRNFIKNGVPHDLAFKPLPKGTTEEEKKALQNALNSDFEVWRSTWLFPWIDQIEEALKR